jgi:hypothetical protein
VQIADNIGISQDAIKKNISCHQVITKTIKINIYNTRNNNDASMNTIIKLTATILSLLLFNTAIASTEDPSDKEIHKNNFILDELPALQKISSLLLLKVLNMAAALSQACRTSINQKKYMVQLVLLPC